jgi:hypothetical protein
MLSDYQYVRIAYIGEPMWIHHIVKRLEESSSSVLRKGLPKWIEAGLFDLMLAFPAKLLLIDDILQHIDKELACLNDELVEKGSAIKKCFRDGHAYSVSDCKLPYRLLTQLDSFIYYTRSAYEIMGKFLRQFCRFILNRQIDEPLLIQYLDEHKLDTRWISELSEIRELIFHDISLWPALRKIPSNPPRFELLMLKRFSDKADDPNDYREFAKDREIYDGFVSSLPMLSQWMMERIEELERQKM